MATGFLSGLTGTVGLLFNRFYLRYGLSKEEIIATTAANELLLHVLKIVLYCLFGLITVKVLSIGFIISVTAIISARGLKNLLGMITENAFKKIGFSAMVISGMFMLVSAGLAMYNERQFRFSVYKMDQGMETKMRWKQSNFSLEFEYDEGVAMERTISLSALPSRLQKLVHGINKHYYEIYVYREGKLEKRDLY